MRKFLFGLLVLVLSLSFLGCQKNADTSKAFDYQKATLDNGLTVITLEDFSSPIAAVQVWYHVGSKNEDPNRQGFAHMFEHMMFRGTEYVGPEEHSKLIKSVGGTTNGYTSFDRTVYLETLPADQLELALWLEAERMAFLNIDKDSFLTERKVVEEELRMRLNRPYGTVWEKVADGIFQKHPYQWMPIGQLAHLRAAAVRELQNFWLKYYGPENATVIIVGAVEHSKAQELTKEYFGWIQGKDKPQQVNVVEPQPNQPQEVRIKGEKAPAPIVGLGWKTVAANNIDSIKLDLLAEVLGSGKSSRLYKKLVDETRLAVGAEAGTYSLEQAGIFGAGAILPPMGGNEEKAMSLLLREVEKLRAEPVSEKELLKAKNQMLKSLVVNNLTIENKAEMLGQATIDIGNTEYVNQMIADIQAVTVADLQNAAKKYLRADNVYKVYVEQNMGETFSNSSDQENSQVADSNMALLPPGRGQSKRPADFPKMPPLEEVKKVSLKPYYVTKTLDNGLKVIVVPNDEVPFVSIQLGLTWGGWMDSTPGQCYMTMQMLTAGTENYTAAQLAEELDTYAINLGASGSMDNSSVFMNCLSDEADRGMRLLSEVVLHPTFPDDEFEKEKEKLLTSLEVKSKSPEYKADREFAKQLFGEGHAYSRAATGEISDVNNLKIEELKQWWFSFVNPHYGTLIFAGDIDPEKAFKITQEYLGSWPKCNIMWKLAIPGPAKDQPTRIVIVDEPGSPQSQIRIGHSGITRKQQPEYFTSRIVSNYFGWGLDSRLNNSLRNEKGLTYGVWSNYTAYNFAGTFTVNTFTKTESTADAVKAAIDEIKRLKAEPATAEEIERSQKYIAGSFIRNRETPQQVAGDIWLMESQNLGLDYIDNLLEALVTTNVNDCKQLIEKTVHPDKLLIVVVGDAAKIKDQLEAIAPVEIIKATEQ